MSRTVYKSGSARVTVDTRGLEVFRRVLLRGSPELRKGLRESCFEILRFWYNRFLNQGNGSWPDLSDRTKKKKEKAGYNPALVLRATDQLIDAVNPSLQDAPGRSLRIEMARLKAFVGYGGGAPYEGGDPKYAKSFSHDGGTIQALVEIHRKGGYGRSGTGPPREIIVDPDRQVAKRVEIRLQKTINIITGKTNKMSDI